MPQSLPCRRPRKRVTPVASGGAQPTAAWMLPIRPPSLLKSPFPLCRDKARCLVGTFPHPPRLEPDLRLSSHPAQHFPISLGLCSVAVGTEDLEVFQAVCIRRFFEFRTRYDVIHLYLIWMVCLFAVSAHWAISKKDFFS